MSKHSELAEEIAKELARYGYLSKKPTIAKAAALIDQKLSGVEKAVRPFAIHHGQMMSHLPLPAEDWNNLQIAWQSIKTEE